MTDLGIAYVGPMSLSMETLPEILEKVNNPPSVVAIDTETISVKDKTCLGIGVAFSPTEAVYFRAVPEMSEHINSLTNIVCNPKVTKIFHNALFDLEVLTIIGDIWEWPGIDTTNIADTSVMARVQAMESSLYMLSMVLIDRLIMTYEELVLDGGDRKKHPLDLHWSRLADKCVQDCMATYGIYEKLW